MGLAQDLWRSALLKETLSWPLDDLAFGEAIETIIERVGCPEDMIGLLSTGYTWTRKAAMADRSAVEAFVTNLEKKFRLPEGEWCTLAAS